MARVSFYRQYVLFEITHDPGMSRSASLSAFTHRGECSSSKLYTKDNFEISENRKKKVFERSRSRPSWWPGKEKEETKRKKKRKKKNSEKKNSRKRSEPEKNGKNVSLGAIVVLKRHGVGGTRGS